MDILALAGALALPWLAGIAVLLAIDWPRQEPGARGCIALRAGVGYFIGVMLLTLWMRALSAVGVGFSRVSIGLPLALLAIAMIAYAARRGRLRPPSLRAAVAALLGTGRWRAALWLLLLAWLALRFALLGAEAVTRPLYVWDAWMQWAPKARVWYELGRIAPFVGTETWLHGAGNAYFDPSPGHPATIPLLQVWSNVALGHWDDAAMNGPWPLMLIALTCAVCGFFAIAGLSPLAALTGAWLVASLPLVDVHTALPGSPDLLLTATYTLAVLVFYRWTLQRDPRDALVALALALACPAIDLPGSAWAATLLPGIAVVSLPRQGIKFVGIAFAIGLLLVLTLLRIDTVFLGYHLHLDFRPDWHLLGVSYFVLGSWNLLWYGAIALAAFGWRALRRPPLVALAIIVAAGLALLLFAFGFADAAAAIAGMPTFNRATMPLAPLLVCLGMLTWRELTETDAPQPGSATAPLASPL